MNAHQLATAAAADRKWVVNSAMILGRPLRYDAAEAKWWGLVKILTDALELPLAKASRVATASLSAVPSNSVTLAIDQTDSVALAVDLRRYGSIFLANLSRALIHETPKRRGRPSRRQTGAKAIAAARNFGIDIGLLRSALDRTHAERLAMAEANSRLVRELQEKLR